MDFFTIPIEHGYFLYAPFNNLGLKVTLDEYEDKKLLSTLLIDNGFNGHTHIHNIPRYKSVGLPFSLGTTTDYCIGLTSACNMRCSYCFAGGGSNFSEMTTDVLSCILKHIEKSYSKNQDICITFMGDGESFMAEEKLLYACSRLRQSCPMSTLKIVTNGTLLNPINITKIKDLGICLQISYDPLSPYRLLNQTPIDLKDTFALLEQNIIIYSIRSTITPENVCKMPEMVKHISEICPSLSSLTFDPASSTETFKTEIDTKAFFRYFMLAKDTAENVGIDLNTSGWSKSLRVNGSFCGTANPSITFTSEGYITSCSRVNRPDQTPYANHYIYGEYNTKTQDFDVDSSKIAALRDAHTVFSHPECSHCPTKWHCSSGCPAMRSSGDDVCSLNYMLFVQSLLLNWELKTFRNQHV